MRKLLITTAIALIPMTAHANSYADGVKDWYAFKDWHTSLSGPYRDGAEYWASHRSVAHDSCIVAASKNALDQEQYKQGCQAAVDRLTPIDARRNSDMTYRLGFIDGSKNQVNVTEYSGGGVSNTPPSTPAYSPPTPPQVIVEHDTDNAPREPGELCPSAESTMEKILRRETQAVNVSLEYEGGRYVGRSVYICEMKSSVTTGDDQNEFTAKTNSTWRVEWYPKDTLGNGMINVKDITSSPN